MRLLLTASLFATTVLMGCAQMSPAPQAAAPTAPMKTTVSTPTVFAGAYTKVVAPAGTVAYIMNIKNGDVLTSPVTVQFGLKGMGVAPAGTEKAGTGHHHLLVNVNELDVNASVPFNDNHRHFGNGQTETSMVLKPGVYTLQMLVADHNHIPHHPPVMSERITVTVK